MQPIYSTDYFAIIPHATVGGFVDPDKKSGTIRHLTNAAVADFATAALAAITVIMVVLVVFNWSR
jgi:hypothetical protein